MLIVVLILLFLFFAGFFLHKAIVIISGYGAKVLCSAVFVCGRKAADVLATELSALPFSLGKYTVDEDKRTATGSVYGLGRKTAVYRGTLGAVLINRTTKEIESATTTTIPKFTTPVFADQVFGPPKPYVPGTHLAKAIELAFADPEQRGTRAVIVHHRGSLVAERYAEGFSNTSRLAGWSMAKSITGALIGILVKQNKLAVDAPAPIANWSLDNRKNITLKHLLQMSSGLRWWEYYAAPSDVTNMLYNETDMGHFAATKPLAHLPGTRFNYSSGTTNILSQIIRATVGETRYQQFPYTELFQKIGMHSAILEADQSGTFVCSSYCFATARDWCRFGLLYLNNGVWNGERILPEDWVSFTQTPTTAICQPDEARYGAHWWLNASKNGEAGGRKYPDVPEDCLYCQGYEGTKIFG